MLYAQKHQKKKNKRKQEKFLDLRMARKKKSILDCVDIFPIWETYFA